MGLHYKSESMEGFKYDGYDGDNMVRAMLVVRGGRRSEGKSAVISVGFATGVMDPQQSTAAATVVAEAPLVR